MENKIAIKIQGLSKKYNLSRRHFGLSFTDLIKNIFRRKESTNTYFYALKDINLDINKGECIGIIGRNGAGKSTLLKILSEVVEATEGIIEIDGSIASVLEVGMGFHPELTGRENVFLNASLLGIPKKEILGKFDSILELSGIGKFIDTPVKHYSSGMFVRLAFSVVTNLDADIFLFDETLSTGDHEFQNKCYEIIDSLIEKGKTVVLVSHNLNDIVKISSRIIYIDHGTIKSDSQSNSLDLYLKDTLANNSILLDFKQADKNSYVQQKTVMFNPRDCKFVTEDLCINKIQICAVNKTEEDEILTSDEIELSIEYYKKNNFDFFNFGFSFIYLNTVILYAHSLNSALKTENYFANGDYIVKLKIPPCFFNDVNLHISLNITKNNNEIIYVHKKILHIKLVHQNKNPEFPYFKDTALSKYRGPVLPKWNWAITKT